jgi:hypothetical protein
MSTFDLFKMPLNVIESQCDYPHSLSCVHSSCPRFSTYKNRGQEVLNGLAQSALAMSASE